MNASWPWSVLEIPDTSDIAELKRAYARLLKMHRPDQDPVAFQALHQAYTFALDLLSEAQRDPNPHTRSDLPLSQATQEHLSHDACYTIDRDEPALPASSGMLAEPTAPPLLSLNDEQANELAQAIVHLLMSRAAPEHLHSFLNAQAPLDDHRTRFALGQLLLEYLAECPQAPSSASFAQIRGFFGYQDHVDLDGHRGNPPLAQAIALNGAQQQLEWDLEPPGWRSPDVEFRAVLLEKLLKPLKPWRMVYEAIIPGRIAAYNALIARYELLSEGQSERLVGIGKPEAWARLDKGAAWTPMYIAILAARVFLVLLIPALLLTGIISRKHPTLGILLVLAAIIHLAPELGKLRGIKLVDLFNQPSVYAAIGICLPLGVSIMPLTSLYICIYLVIILSAFYFANPDLSSMFMGLLGSIALGLCVLQAVPIEFGIRLGLLTPCVWIIVTFLINWSSAPSSDNR